MKVLALGLVFAIVAVVAIAQAPPKPIWPTQFASPFGLNMLLPPTRNASAMLYYNWKVKAQVVEYGQHCLPFISAKSWFYPCKLYFNPSGIYVSQPNVPGYECCSFFPGVGSIPPRFLDPFNFTNVEMASDMYGKQRTCNHWTGIDGFAYWTDVRTEEDVQFKDGQTGVFWNFGEFIVESQDPAIFQLPTSTCSKPCGGSFTNSFAQRALQRTQALFNARAGH